MGSLVSLADIMPAQPSLFQSAHSISLAPEVESMLAANCAVAIGVSGGKDSVACALAVAHHLDAIGHRGPRLLIHADLGELIEWADSLRSCERLAAHLGWELVVVRRAAGDMIARWQKRWENNVARYANLECVKLILPWSTPGMRFCTSELKSGPITSELRRRFKNLPILSVTGIRRQESSNRSRMPIYTPSKNLTRKNFVGGTWNAIIDYRLNDVFTEISAAGLQLHDAYTRYGSTRVSCCYCIMSSEADLQAAARAAENHAAYHVLVELEAVSGFAFQGNRWLADVAPHLLTPELCSRIVRAKEVAKLRREAEDAIDDHLLYEKGWPKAVPNRADAELLARVRRRVSELMGIKIEYVEADSIINRYEEMMLAKAGKSA
jgi:3'-phosphoadenosine 5'-phosphosulfate sulfotransferase (PAPS reductase)/FAD synthetase